jgi:alanyl aminopeptidase
MNFRIPSLARWVFLPALAVALAGAAAGCRGAAPPAAPGAVVAPVAAPRAGGGAALQAPANGRLPGGVRPTHYALRLTIDPRAPRFSGQATIEVAVGGAQEVIWLHARGLRVSRAVEERSKLAATVIAFPDHDLLALQFPQAVGPGEIALGLTWDGAFDRQLAGLYKVEVAGESYAFTQFEPTYARQAFPAFDEPGMKTPYVVTLTVPREHTAISNGPALEATETETEMGTATGGAMKTVRFAATQPLPTYLVAFAVGPLEVVAAPDIAPTAERPRPLPFRGIAARGKGGELGYALAETPKMLLSLERYFGSPYPYDKLDVIAVPDFAAGAMENAGAITFRDSRLLVGPSSTEGERRGFAHTMAHELAHMWFGNLVTMQWWDDIWLNEGFATWMGHRTIGEIYPRYRSEVSLREQVEAAINEDSRVTARRIRQPIDSVHDIQSAFDAITYRKGAGILAMFELWLGAETFQRGVRRYLGAHAFANATSSDLFQALGQESERDVAGPFSSFLEQPGIPRLQITVSCLPPSAGEPRLGVAQSRYLPVGSAGSPVAKWHLPVCARTNEGTACTLVGGATGEVDLPGSRCPRWVMPNAAGVGYYRFALPPDQLGALLGRGWRQLTVTERLAAADAVRASFDDGSTAAGTVLQALAPLARDPQQAVAVAPLPTLTFLQRAAAAHQNQSLRTAVEREAQRLYAPLARRLGWRYGGSGEEEGETKLLRQRVLTFLALVAADIRVRKAGAAIGAGLLDAPAKPPQPSAVASELVELTLALAVQQGGAPAFERALTIFAGSTNAAFRGKLLTALGSTMDPVLAERARNLALDPRVRVNEVLLPLVPQFTFPETREAAWTWLKGNYEALRARAARKPVGGVTVFGLPGGFCHADRAAEVQSFFAPRVGDFPGGPRQLANAVEAINLCAARYTAQQERATAYLTRRP